MTVGKITKNNKLETREQKKDQPYSLQDKKPFIDHLICGLNEVHFEIHELHLIWQMVKLLDISFDDQRPSHINMIKSLYYQFFVNGDKSQSNI